MSGFSTGNLHPFVIGRNGTLRPGDRILKVNGMNLRHAAHAEVVALLKTAKRKITLELEYDVTQHG